MAKGVAKGGFQRYLAAELRKSEKARHRAAIAAIRRRAREAKAERKRRLRDAKKQCRARMERTIKRARKRFRASYAHAIEQQKAETERRKMVREAKLTAARERCALDAADIKAEQDAKIRRARDEEAELRRHARELEGHDKASRARTRAARPSKRVRQSESDDFAKQNIPPQLHALWEREKRRFGGKPGLRRDEQFLEWVHEHPDAVFELARVPSDDALARAERQFAEHYGLTADDYEEAVPF